MNTTIKHGSLAVLVSLLMAGCGPDRYSVSAMISANADMASTGFTPTPFETFTVTNIRRGTETTLIGWAADDLPVYASYDYSDGMETLTADYEYLAGYGELVSHTH